jgi:hypothetical protein
MSTFNSFIDGLTDEEFDRINAMDATELKQYQIRKEAHIANGGEAASHSCPDCNGSGNWRVGYRCYKCNGSGKITNRQMGAVKGKATAAANKAQFATDNADVVEFLAANTWSDFYKSLFQQFSDNGKLSDKQLAAARSGMAKQAAREEQKQADVVRNSGTVELTAIDKLFATAKSNGLKKPIWRAAGLEIHTDRQFGNDTLWIKEPAAGGYVGKLVDGNFTAFRRANDAVLPTLRAIAADPLQAAIAYGQATNKCSCCGRGLTEGVSVVSGIGPICAENWGLDGFRDMAAQAIKEEKKRHKA